MRLQILLILGVTAAATGALAEQSKGMVVPPGAIERERKAWDKAYPPPSPPSAYSAPRAPSYAAPNAPRSLTGSMPTSPTQPWSATAPKGFKPCNNSLVYGACDRH